MRLICIDLDDTLFDFTGAFKRSTNISDSSYFSLKEYERDNDEFGFWHVITRNPYFFANIKPFPYASAIVETAKAVADKVVFLTSLPIDDIEDPDKYLFGGDKEGYRERVHTYKVATVLNAFGHLGVTAEDVIMVGNPDQKLKTLETIPEFESHLDECIIVDDRFATCRQFFDAGHDYVHWIPSLPDACYTEFLNTMYNRH